MLGDRERVFIVYWGKITTPPHLLTVNLARILRTNFLIDLEFILQIQRKDIVLLGCLEFIYEEMFSFPGGKIF